MTMHGSSAEFLAARVENYLEYYEMTKSDFAARCGITVSAVSTILEAERDVRLSTIQKVARGMHREVFEMIRNPLAHEDFDCSWRPVSRPADARVAIIRAIKFYWVRNRLSSAELAEDVGLTQGQLYRIYNGAGIRLSTLESIAHGMGLQPCDVIAVQGVYA